MEEHIIEATCASTTSDQSVNFTLKVKSKDKLAERLIVFRCREEPAMCEHVFLSERFVLVRKYMLFCLLLISIITIFPLVFPCLVCVIAISLMLSNDFLTPQGDCESSSHIDVAVTLTNQHENLALNYIG